MRLSGRLDVSVHSNDDDEVVVRRKQATPLLGSVFGRGNEKPKVDYEGSLQKLENLQVERNDELINQLKVAMHLKQDESPQLSPIKRSKSRVSSSRSGSFTVKKEECVGPSDYLAEKALMKLGERKRSGEYPESPMLTTTTPRRVPRSISAYGELSPSFLSLSQREAGVMRQPSRGSSEGIIGDDMVERPDRPCRRSQSYQGIPHAPVTPVRSPRKEKLRLDLIHKASSSSSSSPQTPSRDRAPRQPPARTDSREKGRTTVTKTRSTLSKTPGERIPQRSPVKDTVMQELMASQSNLSGGELLSSPLSSPLPRSPHRRRASARVVERKSSLESSSSPRRPSRARRQSSLPESGDDFILAGAAA